MRLLRVHFLPELVDLALLPGSHCVVIDVLRATTVIAEALAAGASTVVPCLTIEEARKVAAEFPPGKALLGGERGGLPIEGFDLGNSPAEYTAERIRGKAVVFTTTNGTKALLQCTAASEVLIGSFVNLSAICERLSGASTISLVCAGTAGRVTREDALLAGAVADRLANDGWKVDDSAAIARDAWRHIAEGSRGAERQLHIVAALRESRGGRNLAKIGLAGDIDLAARVDRLSTIPLFDPASGRITSG